MASPRPLRALVVDDERDLASVIGDYLTREGFVVELAYDGMSAIESASAFEPDLVILDIGLPGIDGVEVCREIRKRSDCYVMIVTARSEEIDTLIGLSVGADDYVVKPVSPREIVARARAMLRRPRTPSPSTERHPVSIADLTIDLDAREVERAGEAIDFTKTEFDLLATLASRPRQVFTRQALIEAVWGRSWVGDEHLVDVHLAHVRKKLGDDASRQRYVRTVRGIGYRMGEG